jgi:hypothetical protein
LVSVKFVCRLELWSINFLDRLVPPPVMMK